MNRLPLFGLGLGVLLASAAHVQAAPKKLPLGTVTKIAGAVQKIEAILEMAKLLEKTSRHKGKINVVMPSSKATLKDTRLTFVFLKEGVEASGSVCRVVPGLNIEVPGSAISGNVCADVEIRVELSLDKVTIKADKDFPDTITITIPEMTVASARTGKKCSHHISYGKMTSPKVEGWRGKQLRDDLYDEAVSKARSAFKSDLSEYRQELIRQMEKSLRGKLPRMRIHVK